MPRNNKQTPVCMFMRNEISLSSYLKNVFKHKIVLAQKSASHNIIAGVVIAVEKISNCND